MTKLTEILEQGLTACSKYEQDEQFQIEIARITLKRLENEIVRSHAVLPKLDNNHRDCVAVELPQKTVLPALQKNNII